MDNIKWGPDEDSAPDSALKSCCLCYKQYSAGGRAGQASGKLEEKLRMAQNLGSRSHQRRLKG